MPISDTLLRTAIRATTANGRETPNTYRILSWLYNSMLAEGSITAFSTASDDFEYVAEYLKEHYGIKTIRTRETGAAYEFTPKTERARTGRVPAPPLTPAEKIKYQEIVAHAGHTAKGVLPHHDTKS